MVLRLYMVLYAILAGLSWQRIRDGIDNFCFTVQYTFEKISNIKFIGIIGYILYANLGENYLALL